ncbi:MAG: 30S ribosomal protein S15 [Bacteroidetes bacterium]|nr:30S ribosomal protein S15 [Bacteroidota bacterium]
MILTAEAKKEIFKTYGGSDSNTGSAESQIALFTQRITHLTSHLQKQPKDFGTQRSLIKLVGKRRSLLNYLHNTEISRYRAIISKLGIRK